MINATLVTVKQLVACSTEKLFFINNSPILLRLPGKKTLIAAPHPLGNYLLLEPPPPPRNFHYPPWGGGAYAGYFLELHIFFYSLCKEMKQQMEEQTTVFVQITYKSQQQVPRHIPVVPKHMADICTSEYLAVTKF